MFLQKEICDFLLKLHPSIHPSVNSLSCVQVRGKPHAIFKLYDEFKGGLVAQTWWNVQLKDNINQSLYLWWSMWVTEPQPGPSTVFRTGSAPSATFPPFSALPGCRGITRQRHGNLSRPVTCCLIQIGCGNSPFHSYSLPVARARTNLQVTMTIKAAGWPSVCAFSRSFPPFLHFDQSGAFSHPSPHVCIIHLRPTSPSHLLGSPQLHPIYTDSHHRWDEELLSLVFLSHLGAHCHPSVWAQPLTHL